MYWRVLSRALMVLLALAAGIIIGAFGRVAPLPTANPVMMPATEPKLLTINVPVSAFIDVSYDKTLKKWPIRDAMEDWNDNDKIQFSFNHHDNPLAEIYITTRKSLSKLQDFCGAEAWGCWDPDAKVIVFWTGVPSDMRRLLLCHELGHVLGFDHDDPGCMQTEQDQYSRPGSKNLDDLYFRFFWL